MAWGGDGRPIPLISYPSHRFAFWFKKDFGDEPHTLWSVTTVVYHPHFTEPGEKDVLLHSAWACVRQDVLPALWSWGIPFQGRRSLGAETGNYTQRPAAEPPAHSKSAKFLGVFPFFNMIQ